MSCKRECSESSEKSCQVPCCAPNVCGDHYSAYEICCKKRSAVVSIVSQFNTVPQGSTAIPDGDANPIRTFSMQGSGAFVKFCKRRYILTSSALVLFAPSILAENQRYPASGVENPNAGEVPKDLVAASRILVAVRNLNGRTSPSKHCEDGHTIVYDASPAFVDGAGGWALLYIDHCNEWNRCRPSIEDCHPHFDLGESRKLNPGDELYLLGDWSGKCRDAYTGVGFGIAAGIVANHRAVDHSGWFPAELVWGAFEAYYNVLGCPMVNKYGQIVGVQVSNVPGNVDIQDIPVPGNPVDGHGFVAGISTYFMQYGLKCFSVVGSRKAKYDCFRRHLGSVKDTYHNDYYKYLKGFVGIAYRLVEPYDYNTRLYDGSNGYRIPLIQSSTTGGLYDGPVHKNLAGVVVQNVAGNSAVSDLVTGLPNSYVVVQGATNPAPAPPFDTAVDAYFNSNFVVNLQPETIITAGEGCYFGSEARQIPPALLTWKYIGGDTISFIVRRPSFDATNPLVPLDNHLRDSNAVAAKLLDFPVVYDYPWGNVTDIPLPLDTAYAVIVAPPLGANLAPLLTAATKTAI